MAFLLNQVFHSYGLRLCRIKILILCIFTTFFIGCFLSFASINSAECNCNTAKISSIKISSGGHKLGVVVPFRDRFEELLEFAPHIHKFLVAQNIDHTIYIINQVDQYRFNRASLINVGFIIAISEGCDYFVMHDVDLLPLNPLLSYAYPSDGLFHVASPELHPRYHYPSFVGGILIVKREDFQRVNGMSNKYWGWGLEDDEFYVRLKEAKLKIIRPTNLTSGVKSSFRHVHDRVWRKRDMAKCFNQQEVNRRRDRQTGLKDVMYQVQSQHTVIIDNASVNVINVALKCNRTLTPWCLCSEENKSSTANFGKVNRNQNVKNKNNAVR
ncbi:beta-1,4-galactosyltransferase 7 isoform X1 [Lycorma delicatula]|uniref:beta-1,4-galactosyltransferase 7 isoform X1 n=1 Tax=Lycorma delicatula TaxID=130591 RepID=UPI003F51807E